VVGGCLARAGSEVDVLVVGVVHAGDLAVGRLDPEAVELREISAM
jgi:hypothetical protein